MIAGTIRNAVNQMQLVNDWGAKRRLPGML